ncbi:CACTIN [Bugula neritina]|uniref:Splicing factor Cactin n=1 Tax=Bugula neritina TaxID=10212 RepID=A0A7J7KSZ6_BUGNE|nr:CACTIN [Bugula neritina]
MGKHKDRHHSRSLSRERSQSPNRSRDDFNKHRSSEKKKSKHMSKHRYSDSDSSSDGSREKRHKKGKSRKRQRQSRSPSADYDERRTMDVEIMKEEHRRQKEMMKAYETPEEKRARRLAKKELKERKRKSEMGWDKETLQYTNEDNPFGDHNLTATFVWKAKLKREGKSLEDAEKHSKATMGESRESDYYSAWEKQEDTFHLDQAKERSRIRIEDGRAKPIDLLAKYINAEDDDMSVEMHEPYTYLEGLSVIDLEDLLEDIKVYLELEKGKNQDYWRDITTVTEDQLSQARRLHPGSSAYEVRDRREGIHTAVSSDVESIFKGKTLKQLSLLEDQVKKKLKGGEGDVGYWESLLQQLKAHMAFTRLKEQHQFILKKRLAKLRQEQALESVDSPKIKVEESQEFKEPPAPSVPSTSQLADSKPSTSAELASEKEEPSPEEPEDGEAEDVEDEYDEGRCSPKLLTLSEVEEGLLIYNPEEDMKRLEMQRLSLRNTGKVQTDGDGALVQRAKEGMAGDEVRFSVEYNLEQQSFVWSDKYRPRKPRFFNRVHTGFEWNKYNQTHYDMDNPPPKIVQGYKFNIFYPDLIDKANTPQYSVIPIEDDKDFSVLKFAAGPPYEDIAFKIVNREWEYSYKHGFKCQFQNDIFQLWFHFRRYRYRR